MKMLQCANGHYYDANLFSTCPYCAEQSADFNDTLPIQGSRNVELGGRRSLQTVPVPPSSLGETSNAAVQKDRTQAVIKQEMGFDPVVGWLVCIGGNLSQKGQDYPLFSRINYIGRDRSMGVCILGDDSISRRNHAYVAYDRKNCLFLFGNGMGTNIVYLNDAPVIGSSVRLQAMDRIIVGNTELLFIPLCGSHFSWERHKQINKRQDS